MRWCLLSAKQSQTSQSTQTLTLLLGTRSIRICARGAPCRQRVALALVAGSSTDRGDVPTRGSFYLSEPDWGFDLADLLLDAIDHSVPQSWQTELFTQVISKVCPIEIAPIDANSFPRH